MPNWTFDPIVHVTGPGHIAVRCAGKLIGGLEQGAMVDALLDVFDSEWLPAMFDHEREEVRREHAALQAAGADPDGGRAVAGRPRSVRTCSGGRSSWCSAPATAG